jgi:hypothetical protein
MIFRQRRQQPVSDNPVYQAESPIIVYQAESPIIVNSQHCDTVVLGWTQMGVYF